MATTTRYEIQAIWISERLQDPKLAMIWTKYMNKIPKDKQENDTT